VALGAAVTAGNLNARFLPPQRDTRRFGLEPLASGDRFGQGLAGAAATLFGPRFVHFVSALGRVGQDEHLIARYLQKAAADRHGLFAATSLDPDHTRLQRGQQRRVPRQYANHALRPRRDNHVNRLFGEHFAFRGHNLHAQRHDGSCFSIAATAIARGPAG
jgi:hypothetical protein